MNDLTPMERRAVARMEAETARLRARKAMSDDPMLALRRDIERLRAYARWLEDTGPRKTVGQIRDEREEHVVAELMRADDTPQPLGWSGDGA